MAAQGLRIVAAATFLPAFPILLAHGVVSHSVVPAVGLVPLAVSSSVSLFIVVRLNKKKKPGSGEEEGAAAPANAREGEGEESAAAPEQPLLPQEPSSPPTLSEHSVLIFAVDVVLAAALLTVLVFSWMAAADFDGQSATLAAYGTIPLLSNFLIHLRFAVRAFSTGLALHDLTQWLAWQLVPADCPDCGHRLRPASPPTMPWLESARRVRIRLPAVSLPFPSASSASSTPAAGGPSSFFSFSGFRTQQQQGQGQGGDGDDVVENGAGAPRRRVLPLPSPSEWRAPAWFRKSWARTRRDGETAALFAGDDSDNDADAVGRYRDDVAGGDDFLRGGRGAAAAAASDRVLEPEEVAVTGKKATRKAQDIAPPANEWAF